MSQDIIRKISELETAKSQLSSITSGQQVFKLGASFGIPDSRKPNVIQGLQTQINSLKKFLPSQDPIIQDNPQPKNNTLRNALLLGGALALVL